MVPFVRVWVHAHFCSKHTPTLTLRFTFATNRHNLVQREIILVQVYDLLQCKTVGVNFTLSEPLSNEALLICLDLHASPILSLLAALALSASKTILVLALKVMFFKNLQYRARCGCSVFGKVRRQEFLRSTQTFVSAKTSSNTYLWGFFISVLSFFQIWIARLSNWSLSKPWPLVDCQLNAFGPCLATTIVTCEAFRLSLMLILLTRCDSTTPLACSAIFASILQDKTEGERTCQCFCNYSDTSRSLIPTIWKMSYTNTHTFIHAHDRPSDPMPW